MFLLRKTKRIQIVTLLLLLTTLFFCLCGILVAFSYPLGDVALPDIDTSIFEPEVSFLAGLCLWIPGILTAVAAYVIWFQFGRTPLQQRLAQAQTENERLRELTLQTYLDQMGELLLRQGVENCQTKEHLTQFIQRRSLETLAILDARRKRTLLQFLLESDLITGRNAIHLELVAADAVLLQEIAPENTTRQENSI